MKISTRFLAPLILFWISWYLALHCWIGRFWSENFSHHSEHVSFQPTCTRKMLKYDVTGIKESLKGFLKLLKPVAILLPFIQSSLIFFSLLQYVQLSIKDQEIREKLTSSTHDYFLFYKNMIFRIFMIWHITFECYFNFTSYLKHRLSIRWECFNILWSQLFVDLKMSTVTKCLLPQMFLL